MAGIPMNGRNGGRISRWLFIMAIAALIMAVGAAMTAFQIVNGIRVGPPFNLSVDVAEDLQVCVGETVPYTLHLTVTEVPIHLVTHRAWVTIDGGEVDGVRYEPGRTVHTSVGEANHLTPTHRSIESWLTVPPMPVGRAELRVVGTAIYYPANGYTIPFEVVSCGN